MNNTNILMLLCLLVWGCGATPKTKDPRAQLRKNAQQASDINYQKPLGKKTLSPSSQHTSNLGKLQKGACVDQPSCFPTSKFLLAKGQGEGLREAELDAKARLSAKIRSEITSTITQKVSEGDGQQANSQGTIVSQVKTSFSRGELIDVYPIQEDDQGVHVIAVLEKAKYQKLAEEDLQTPLNRLATKLGEIDNKSSLEDLVQPWRSVLEMNKSVQGKLAEYRAVLGRLPTIYKKLHIKMDHLQKLIDTKVSKVSFILTLEGEEKGDVAIKALLKQSLQTLKLKVKTAGECLKGHYLVKVNYEFTDSVHPLTGGQSLILTWQANLLACHNEGEPVVVHSITLPKVKGTERYQTSALTQVEKYLKNAKKELRNQSVKPGKKPPFSKELLSSMKQLIAQIIPVSN